MMPHDRFPGVASAVLFLVMAATASEAAGPDDARRTVSEAYPGLATGVLTYAVLARLPDGVLVRSDGTEITAASIEERIARESGSLRKELEANAFFVLETTTTREILLAAAKRWASRSLEGATTLGSNELIQTYVRDLAKHVEVSDDEVARFYEENKQTLCGATFEQVREQIRQYLLGDKKDAAVADHIRTYGRENRILVSAAWVERKSGPARENPIDRVRWSGRPTFVDFGGGGCCGPDKMLPGIERLRATYGDEVGIVYVEAREHPVLATRYGARSIPTLIFFDAKGAESYRRSGAMSEAEIRSKLRDAGAE